MNVAETTPDRYADAVAEAVAENGKVALVVTCEHCAKSRPLGAVHITSRGLLFAADVVAYDAWKNNPHARDTFDTAGTEIRYRVRNLIDWPDAPAWEPSDGPRVTCPSHGTVQLDFQRVAARARQARAGRRLPVYVASTQLASTCD